jgi:predicted  nucleic acid-binding Zn-ribbon protein
LPEFWWLNAGRELLQEAENAALLHDIKERAALSKDVSTARVTLAALHAELREVEAQRTAGVHQLSAVRLQLERDATELASKQNLLSERHRTIRVHIRSPQPL